MTLIMSQIDNALDWTEVTKIIDKKFSKDQFQAIIKNIIEGKVNFYIAEKTYEMCAKELHHLVFEIMESAIKSENIKILINKQIKEFIYNGNFENKIGSEIEIYFRNKFPYESEEYYGSE